MSAFAKFLVDRLRAKRWEPGFPIRAENGTEYGAETGQGPANLEIDWDKLQKDIEALEREFVQRGGK